MHGHRKFSSSRLRGFATTSARADEPTPQGQAASPSGALSDESMRQANAWRVRPAPSTSGESRNYFVLEADPGAAIADVMVVENLSGEAKTLQVYGQEALLTPDGKYSAPAGRPIEGSFGKWISPSVETVTIEPYATVEVPFTIAVPQGATPGDYDGAVFTTLSEPTDQNGKQVVLDFRVGVRVHLRVKGDLGPRLEISEVTPVRLTPWWNPFPADVGVSFKVTNTGNVRISGKVVTGVVADYLWRKERQSGLDSVESPELLPGSSIVFSAEPVAESGAWAQGPHFTGLWEFGKQTYTVHVVNAKVPNSDVYVPSVQATAEVWMIPWIPLGILVLILLVTARWGFRKIFAARIERRATEKVAQRAAKDAGRSSATTTYSTAEGLSAAPNVSSGDGFTNPADHFGAGSAPSTFTPEPPCDGASSAIGRPASPGVVMRRAVVLGISLALVGLSVGACTGQSNLGPSEATPPEASASLTAGAPGGEPSPTALDGDKDSDTRVLAQVAWNTGEDGHPTLAFTPPLEVTGPTARVISDGDGAEIHERDSVTFEYQMFAGDTGELEYSSYASGKPQIISVSRKGMSATLAEALIGRHVGANIVFATVDSSGNTVSDHLVTAFMALTVTDAHPVPARAEGDPVAPVEGLPAVTLAENGAPSIEIPSSPPPTELVSQNVIDGQGPKLVLGQSVILQLTGWLWASGEKFDSTWDVGNFLVLDLSTESTIPGIVHGLEGKRVGSQVLLIIPPSLGLGETAAASIPASSTLVYVIDILDVQ